MSENGEIYTAGKKFYTAAGTDGTDKFHLCIVASTTISIILTCGGFVGFGWNKFHSGVRLIVKEGIWLQQEGT